MALLLTFAESKLLHEVFELALLDAVSLERLEDVVFDGRLVHDLELLARHRVASLLDLQVAQVLQPLPSTSY